MRRSLLSRILKIESVTRNGIVTYETTGKSGKTRASVYRPA